jgi:HK97 family phage portal protein
MATLIQNGRQYIIPDATAQKAITPGFLDRARIALKAVTWTFGGTGQPFDQGDSWLRGSQVVTLRGSPYGNTAVNYGREEGNTDYNSIVMACIFANMEAVMEAPVKVMRRQNSGRDDVVLDHGMTRLLRNPNPLYPGPLLWMPPVMSYRLDGNAYWLKVRNGSDAVIRLWYEPHWTIRPAWDSRKPEAKNTPVTHYELYRGGAWQDIPTRDVMHFRYGIDPRDPKLGLGPLKSALREIFTDNEAAQFSAVVLKNTGVSGVAISPKGEGMIDDPDKVKLDYMEKTSGDRRGEPIVFESPVELQNPSFSPEEMLLTAMRRVPEERLSALLRTPAIAAGLGAGLDRSTYSNMAEAREHFYEGGIIPTQVLFAATLDTQLLPEFGNPDREYTEFDNSKVRVLQDDENRKAEKWQRLYDAGLARRSEGRAAFDLETTPDDEVYKLTAKAELIGPDNGPVVEPEPEPVPPALNGNGNGAVAELEDLEVVAVAQ